MEFRVVLCGEKWRRICMYIADDNCNCFEKFKRTVQVSCARRVNIFLLERN